MTGTWRLRGLPRYSGEVLGGRQGALPRAARVKGRVEWVWSPASPLWMPDAAGQGEGEGAGTNSRSVGREGGGGGGGSSRGRKGVPCTTPPGSRSSPTLHSPLPTRQPLVRIFMNTCAQMGGWWGGEKNNEKKKKATLFSYFVHSLSSKSRCAVACKARRTLPCC